MLWLRSGSVSTAEGSNRLPPGFHPITPPVSRRHVARLADLSDEERAALWELVPAARQRIERAHAPEGYNLGLNDGAAAGQTVPHVHLHVIPRYAGDTADPRGGVRRVIPERVAYWGQTGEHD
jgi:diadenosine tetraphosphate (Ap4A) HIT family hydrolase